METTKKLNNMITRLGICFDGGGQRGLIPSILMGDVESELNKQIYQVTDMFGGTSSGGIMSMLFSTGYAVKDIMTFFTQDGPTIFTPKSKFNPMGLFKAQYSGKVLESILKVRFNNMTLTNVKVPVLCPSFDIRTNRPIFFKTTDALKNESLNYPLWSVARATSAAQTYFPAFPLKDMMLIDGGNIANNPSACLYVEMKRKWPNDRIKILSIGCGITQNLSNKNVIDNAPNWGAIRNAITTIDVLFSASSEMVDYELKTFLGKDYLRIEPVLMENVTLDGASPEFLCKLTKEGNHLSHDCLDEVVNFICSL